MLSLELHAFIDASTPLDLQNWRNLKFVENTSPSVLASSSSPGFDKADNMYVHFNHHMPTTRPCSILRVACWHLILFSVGNSQTAALWSHWQPHASSECNISVVVILCLLCFLFNALYHLIVPGQLYSSNGTVR
jgi:hypothetical protein